VLRHPSLKHRATMPLALSMALAWYTTTLPQPQSFILVLLPPSSLYVVRYLPFVLIYCSLCSFICSLCSFVLVHVPFLVLILSSFSLCCSLCSLPVYYGRYSCSFVRFMQARGRSLQIAVARSDGQIFHADALCPVLIRPHSFSKVLRKPFAGSSDAAARVASPACAPASSSAPTTTPSTATAASSRRPATPRPAGGDGDGGGGDGDLLITELEIIRGGGDGDGGGGGGAAARGINGWR
jgi:hypothetical protein